jgi:hypothetical protein
MTDPRQIVDGQAGSAQPIPKISFDGEVFKSLTTKSPRAPRTQSRLVEAHRTSKEKWFQELSDSVSPPDKAGDFSLDGGFVLLCFTRTSFLHIGEATAAGTFRSLGFVFRCVYGYDYGARVKT